MLLFEGDFVPTGDNVIEFLCVVDGELVTGGVPGGGEDEFLELGMVLAVFLRLARCKSVEDVVLGVLFVFDVLLERGVSGTGQSQEKKYSNECG